MVQLTIGYNVKKYSQPIYPYTVNSSMAGCGWTVAELEQSHRVGGYTWTHSKSSFSTANTGPSGPVDA